MTLEYVQPSSYSMPRFSTAGISLAPLNRPARTDDAKTPGQNAQNPRPTRTLSRGRDPADAVGR